jgi:hypothetical protein
MSDTMLTYVIGEDEDGEHSFLTLNFTNQDVVIIQANDEGEDNDVIILNAAVIEVISKIVQMHTDASGNLIKDRPNVH